MAINMKKQLLDAEKIKQTLAGYQEASRVIEEERKKRLKSMTPAESLEIYDALCEFYYSLPLVHDSDKLEKGKIEFLVHRRDLMNRIAKRKPNE